MQAALAQTGHFDVDGLVNSVRASGHDVSKATVYRALPLLVETGIVQHTEVSINRGSFETSYGREHHDHLICRDCEKVVEFHFEAFEMLQRALAEQHGFVLVSHVHELIGVCAACRDKAKARESDARIAAS